MKHIGIFCSASENINQSYFEHARLLGQWMGENGKTLIYGGASLGLMECIAAAVKKSGGEVVGVVPVILEENGRVSQIPDEVVYTQNLSDRKDIIVKRSDILVALPGGIGTLDEVFHVMSAATIGYHDKKVVFYNIDGFYDDLFKVFEGMQEANFARRAITNYYAVANTWSELIELIKN